MSGIEYHNASAQTIPKVRVPSQIEKFHRDTQTVTKKNKVQQTTNTTSTQMVIFRVFQTFLNTILFYILVSDLTYIYIYIYIYIHT